MKPFCPNKHQHKQGGSNYPCDASFEPLMLNRLKINGGGSLGVCFLHLKWIGEVAQGDATLADTRWGQVTPPSGPWWPCRAPITSSA
jgi:hypothetical protein